MANAADMPAGQPALKRAGNSIEWSHPPAAPGWMAWTPHAAICGLLPMAQCGSGGRPVAPP